MKKFNLSKGVLALGMALCLAGNQANAAYPASLSDIAGVFVCNPTISDYASNSYSTDGTFYFQITEYNSIIGFLGGYVDGISDVTFLPEIEGGLTINLGVNRNDSSIPAYDPETGIITFSQSFVNIAGTYYAFAVGGSQNYLGWNNYTSENLMHLQVSEDGNTITSADFSFGNLNKLASYSWGDTFGNYTNFSATRYEVDVDNNRSPIEGYWNVTRATVGSNSTQETKSFIATLAGNNVVTFVEDDGYGDAESATFQADFNPDTNTLTFKEATFYGSVTQIPYTNGNVTNISQLNNESFTATFNGTDAINFTENTGLRYGNEAYNFVSATKTAGFAPSIVLRYDDWTNGDGSLIVKMKMLTYNFDTSLDLTWGASVTQILKDDEGNETQESVNASRISTNVDFEEGIATVTISGLSEGVYDFMITLTAYNDGSAYASGEYAVGGAKIGSYLEIQFGQYTIEGTSVNYSAMLFNKGGLPANPIYKMRLVPYAQAFPLGSGSDVPDPDYTSNAIDLDCTLGSNNYFSATQTGLEPGNYHYAFGIVVFENANSSEPVLMSNFIGTNSFTIADQNAPSITITNGASYLDDALDLVLTFNAEFTNFDDVSVGYYEVNASYPDHNIGGRAEKTVTPEISSNGNVSATLVNMPSNQQNFSINVTLGAYDSEGNVIAESNEIIIMVQETGIEGISTENGNVRYFDLNGVEIARPEKGIYIRVEGKKATKQIAR